MTVLVPQHAHSNGHGGGGGGGAGAAAQPGVEGQLVALAIKLGQQSPKLKSTYSEGALWQMLRNFRLRRRLGLCERGQPGDSQDEDSNPRWLRQTWRPLYLPAHEVQGDAGEEEQAAGASAAASRTSELEALASELQQRVERGYRELNAARRALSADAEGLRRQGASASAIAEEVGALRAQLEEKQRKVSAQIAENGALSLQLGLERQTLADSLTQAALLASAVSRISGGNGRPGDGSAEARSTVAALEEELQACRLQIAALLDESEALSEALEPKKPPSSRAPAAVPGFGAGAVGGPSAASATFAPQARGLAAADFGTGATPSVSSKAAAPGSAGPGVGSPAAAPAFGDAAAPSAFASTTPPAAAPAVAAPSAFGAAVTEASMPAFGATAAPSALAAAAPGLAPVSEGVASSAPPPKAQPLDREALASVLSAARLALSEGSRSPPASGIGAGIAALGAGALGAGADTDVGAAVASAVSSRPLP
eukprot:CAMPEP_0203913406 /NCGR_PEP_ID=MMETSP0359-20131031/54410_1 /ASSEMBLY_ACC=CAM_ASM_000338 /TAXON_ID=268821 /ORGANISM="Scrippsiella Hangoei, Strain SHTV-5" /LENGTH=483 /DNA_ID=CAMNT_0050839545 /DNA_START=42 /DNA_END=1490 /DNA_ORIENTATION=-